MKDRLSSSRLALVGRREAAFEQTSTLLLPVVNAEYQIQVLSDRRSSALMHSATTRDDLFTV